MNAKMLIETAQIGDAQALCNLAVQFRNHLQKSMPLDNALLSGIQRLLNAQDSEFLVYRMHGSVVGYVLLRFRYSMWIDGLEATLEDLFVDMAHRKSGAGKALVQHAVEAAKKRQCKSICLDTNEKNTASNKIYAGLGFNAFSQRWQGNQMFFRLYL